MKRIIYVKTPKTAGTSVENLLRGVLESHVHIYGQTRKWPSEEQLRETELIVVGDVVAKKFRQRFLDLWRESTSFTIVRNPYDRLLSAWKYCESTKDSSLQLALSEKLPRRKWWKKYSHDYVHFSMRQSDFVVQDNALIVDHLIRFESLEEDLANLFRQHDVELPPLPHLNKTRARSRKLPGLSQEVLSLIDKRFGRDFDFFDYDRVSAPDEDAVECF